MKNKRHHLLATCLLCIIVIGFNACKKDDDTKKPIAISDYLSSYNGEYVDESFPSSSGTETERPVISAVNGNASVISGGTNILSISYTDEQDDIQKILLGIKGINGYYTLNNPNLKSSNITFPLYLGQNLQGNFIVIIALKDAQGNISAEVEIPVETVEAGTGDLQITLTWDKLNDVDLHLELPNSNEIYYGDLFGIGEDADDDIWDYLYENYEEETIDDMSYEEFVSLYKSIAEQLGYRIHSGFLDLDSNPDCEIDSVNNENISFGGNSTILNGEYIVRADFYENCDYEEETNYTITAYYKGQLISPTSGKNPYTGYFNTYDYDQGSEGDGVEIMRFTVTNNSVITLASFNFEHNFELKSNTADNIKEKIKGFRKK